MSEYGGPAGMSLRDWFAGMALPAIMQHKYMQEAVTINGGTVSAYVAKRAYEFADAMLAQRVKSFDSDNRLPAEINAAVNAAIAAEKEPK